MSNAGTRLLRVVLIGLGNIGSMLAAMLARSGFIEGITLIDKDIYEPKNLTSISPLVSPGDVGRFKADAWSEIMHGLNPELSIEAFTCRTEDVPQGIYRRSDLILAALDSLYSRVYVNQVAWNCNVPLIDSAIDPETLRVCINVIVPGETAACYECGLFGAGRSEVPVQCLRVTNVPTDGPIYLGGLSASIALLEAMKLFSGDGPPPEGASQRIQLDGRDFSCLSGEMHKNTRCRFDHRIVTDIGEIQLDMDTVTLSELIDRCREMAGYGRGRVLGLGVLGATFIGNGYCLTVQCPRRGEETPVFHLYRHNDNNLLCPGCGTPLDGQNTSFFGMVHPDGRDVDPQVPAASLGFKKRDIIFIDDLVGNKCYFELV